MMNTKELSDWIVKHHIQQRAIEGFWQYISNYEAEESEDFNRIYANIDFNSVIATLNRVALVINFSFDEPVEYVVSYFEISYQGEEIASYEAIYTLNGEDMDDIFQSRRTLDGQISKLGYGAKSARVDVCERTRID